MSIVTKLTAGKYIFVFDYVNGKKTSRVHCKSTRRVRRNRKTIFGKGRKSTHRVSTEIIKDMGSIARDIERMLKSN